MKKIPTSLLTFSLLLIIPATISTERKSTKAMVGNYLNNGGAMIMHSEDSSKELNLLEHFQGLSKLYQGEVKIQDIKKFSHILYCEWVTMSPSDYANLVKDFFIYQYKFDKAIKMIVDNTFNLSQEFSSKLQEHLAWDAIKELYRLQADKKLQITYPMGYLLILLLKGFALFNFYQADWIRFNILQHWILITIAFSEFGYVNLFSMLAFPDFFDLHPTRIFLNTSSFVLMCNNAMHPMVFCSFLIGIINMINLVIISYQSKKRYDACEQKINTMKIQGLKCTEIVDELQETVQLLKNHQDTVLACYQGEPFNKIPGVNSATTEVENVGSIIAQHIDPSIKPNQITRNPSTCESKHSDFRHNFCRSMNIIVPSCVYAAFAGIVLQQYFSS